MTSSGSPAQPSSRGAEPPSAGGDSASSRSGLSPGRAIWLPLAFIFVLGAVAFLPPIRGHAELVATHLGAAGLLLAWAVGLWVAARRAGRALSFEVALYKHHWVQSLTQGVIILYWGWHVSFVYPWIPLIFTQIIFAYGVDSLLQWSRRDHYRLGFGPAPIILSINLFLWFRPEWFYWQFAMILVGYLAKELIRWQKRGRSRHIFNPSSFPLAIVSLALIFTGSTDITLGSEIAQTQYNPPNMYLVIFLASIPVQILFGVARVTMAAVTTVFAISYAYFAVTGTYLFLDSFISVPVFLGMHLLITDPSTSPRSEAGQFIFGILYGLGVVGLYGVLAWMGAPRFYDKLLPVPLLNLTVRAIDHWADGFLLRLDALAKLGEMLTTRQRYLGYTVVWAGIFTALSGFGGVGDDHPGQYLPFWRDACQEGSDRACTYAVFMLSNYCDRGSGWACNEFGIQLVGVGRAGEAAEVFGEGCELGFEPACENVGPSASGGGSLSRARPRVEDLPIILRGSEGPIEERDPRKLYAMGCEQGWSGMCERVSDRGGR